MELLKNLIVGCTLIGLIFVGCANEEGDEVECPVCDEATEALVGTQCVPLERDRDVVPMEMPTVLSVTVGAVSQLPGSMEQSIVFRKSVA